MGNLQPISFLAQFSEVFPEPVIAPPLPSVPVARRSAVQRFTVQIDQPEDVSYWCAKWGIAPYALRRAVEKVGPNPGEISRFLRAQIL